MGVRYVVVSASPKGGLAEMLNIEVLPQLRYRTAFQERSDGRDTQVMDARTNGRYACGRCGD